MGKYRLFFIPFLLIPFLFLPGCKKNSSSDKCSGVTIVVSGTTVNATSNDGSIAATASGSTYLSYNINGGTFQSSGTFNNLAPGSYTVIAKNADGCSGSKVFTVSPTKTYLISQSTWKFSSATVGGSDVSAFLQTCQKDNILTFTITGTGTLNEGATKCNPGDPQTSPFTWNFQSGETILFISTPLFTGGSSTFTLVSLTATQMVLSQIITVGGIPQTAVVTFIH